MTERQAEALRLRADGMTLAEIGEKMGVSRQCVHQYLKDGISDRVKFPSVKRESEYLNRVKMWMKDNEVSMVAMSKELKVSYATIRNLLTAHNGVSRRMAEKIKNVTGIKYEDFNDEP